MLRWITAGESHGPELVCVLEGFPAGVEIDKSFIISEMARRRLGYGRGSRQKFEQDELTISSGVRHGISQGGPIAVRIANTEWPKWEQIMSPEPVDMDQLSGARAQPLTRPRPGHADFTGMQKYGFDESRPVLERASARETAARVALGSIAKAFLSSLGIEIISHTTSIGNISVRDATPNPKHREALDADLVRCADAKVSKAMVDEIDSAKKDGDTLGGTVEVLVYGLPPGLGSYVHWDRKLDGRLAQAMMSIQAMKSVEIGDGLETTKRRGSEAHDEIEVIDGEVSRKTDRAGGLEGGMTNGEILRVKVGMKPISTVPRALSTVDTSTGEEATAHHQRSDVCAVPAAGIIAEAMAALVLADAVIEKFGGDSLLEVDRNMQSYLASIPENLRSRIAR
ncbi:MAG: chorismate synthase [Microbacteriaceae bacterium]|nr:chorismate synthase [Microbacteriaceae bacterium]MDR9443489.1 chorismate synthase [Microbacteriaceae bacterium]